MRELYEKVGRRYVLVGREYHPYFPANGVWLVEDGAMRLIMRVGEVPDPMPLVAMHRYYDVACAAVARVMDRGRYSPADLVEAAFRAIAQKEQADDPPRPVKARKNQAYCPAASTE